MTDRIWLIKRNLKEENGRIHASFDLDREIYNDYLNGRITKTICEARNLNKLLQAREMALNLGLVENLDSGMINDACLTELTPELFIEKSLKKITNAWSNFLDLSRILMKMAKAAAPSEMSENFFQKFSIEHRKQNAPSFRLLIPTQV